MTSTTNSLRITSRTAGILAMTLVASAAAFGTLEIATPSQAQASSETLETQMQGGSLAPAVHLRSQVDRPDVPPKPRKPIVIRYPFGTIVIYR